MKIICLHCGKEGTAMPNKIKKGYGKFCCRKCAREWRSKNFSKEENCAICGKTFHLIFQREKMGKGKYCSNKCRGAALRGKLASNWKGGRRIRPDGYIILHLPNHPRAYADGCVLEHIIIAEQKIGKPLPPKAVVHHINGKTSDNRPENLLICKDNAEHRHIHKKIRKEQLCHQNQL